MSTQDTGSFSLFSDFDIHLFREGTHYHLYEKFGSHVVEKDGKQITYFSVWAPDAKSVSVIGNFNYWDKQSMKLSARWDSSGIWEGVIEKSLVGEAYKYAIETKNGEILEKSDPFARYWEEPPKTASIVWVPQYEWKDKKWMSGRKKKAGKPAPMSVYEVHPGSWMRRVEEENRPLSYREMATELVDYVVEMGFTHVEFLPVMEHPFYGSWGYQLVGYFAPTSRYGSPQDFKFLMDAFHKKGIGVILDWVPSHFPGDAHGLYKFDGTHLYEHADPRKGYHPDWTSYIFNYGRNEVKSVLISSAMFWLDEYHVDGIRVDAVASMLYLDYSRKEGEWIPNEYGGRENLEAVQFIKEMNEALYGKFPDIMSIAEESTSWPNVSKPTYSGGLGFGQKWMMGWMHDSLEFFKKEPVYRKYHHNEISFSLVYAFTENFMLPLSHDEVVHGKGSIVSRMPGDEWQRFANLRLLYGFMFTHPGTKLLFMGNEFGQTSEWNHEASLDWHLIQFGVHKGVQNWVKDINSFYKSEKALYERQFEQSGFEWIDYSDYQNTVIIFRRMSGEPEDDLIVVCNFTPTAKKEYKFGVPFSGEYREVLNSDHNKYGGSGVLNEGGLFTQEGFMHGKKQYLTVTMPPLGIACFKKV